MPPQSDRATCWSITINNPTGADEENMALSRQKGWKVDGQLEVGKDGTPHYQLIVRTPQVRFSAVKKAFPRAHIEVARNPTALEQYVHKDDTKAGELNKQSEMYPSLSKFWDLFYTWLHDNATTNEQETGGILEHLHGQAKIEDAFHQFVNEYIEKGYHIETIACNPATISCIRKYGHSILRRSEDAFYKKLEEQDKQTDVDSQTSENNISS